MDWMLFLLFFGACCAAGTTGAMFPPGDWYRQLSKPPWTPPDIVFPIAWSILYLCLAFAAARVAPMDGAEYALAFWAVQIALNTLWTPVFFGLRGMKAALVVIGFLWLSVAGLLIMLWPLDRLAFVAILPYLLWVTIAGALNASVLRRNPEMAA
ncbi:TspO/MBR family protein [Jannaschia sp. 2305UL9-9]|uniref:tryptophan-rich sensory protein TspO n=1 Tax=Jannaschia sp. 2305UL9-9 TaxID=3121638 RepID=UPI003528316A